MRPLLTNYRENPFFRSTVNVILLQAIFALLTLLVFGAAIWNQQHTTDQIITERRAVFETSGVRQSPESLTFRLEDVRDNTLAITLVVLTVLASLFGYFAARYALEPTRQNLEYQKRFIGNIAHELRTPLAIMRTNTEVALMDPNLTDYARSTFDITIGELDRISGIINNLLSFDSLTRPGHIRFEPLLLRDIAKEVVERHAQMAESFGIALDLHMNIEPTYVMGNKVALEQVVTNLVKNALNYTPQHDDRSVTVSLDHTDDHVSLSVVDTGIGIAQKDLYYVFQPYFRGDTSRERKVGGGTSGLGLAIVNDIVRAHGGSIVIRSALNRGTTIELSFPTADTREHVKNVAQGEDDGQLHEEKIS